MSEPISIPLTAGQSLLFQQFTRQEREAEQTLASVKAARNAAAMAVVLHAYEPDAVQNIALTISDTAITFTPTSPAPPALTVVDGAA